MKWIFIAILFISLVLFNAHFLKEQFVGRIEGNNYIGTESKIDHTGVSNANVFCDRLGHKMCDGARHYKMCVNKVLRKCQDDFMRGKYDNLNLI
jgi:hypothetical protein